MKTINELQQNGVVWVNVSKQGEKELAEVGRRFNLSEQDLKESLPPFQRPKIIKRESYYFMVLHFPIFDRESRRLGFTEVDFYLSPNFLVTAHDNSILSIDNFFNECKKLEKRARNILAAMPCMFCLNF